MTDATYQIEADQVAPNSKVEGLTKAISAIIAEVRQVLRTRKQSDFGSVREAQQRGQIARRKVDNLLR